jgi:4-amino-4-deoxy-L-arabinose transferase-like glycosyltransferase
VETFEPTLMDRVSAALSLRAVRVATSVIVAVALAGVAYSAVLGSTLLYHDERDYLKLARNLVTFRSFTFDGIHPMASRPPGYPLVLALFLSLGLDVVGLRILNFVSLAGCMWLCFLIGRRQWGPIAGLTAVALIACYPLMFYASGTLYPQILGSFLLLLVVWLLFNCSERSSPVYLVAGAVFGFLMLCIPSFLFALWVSAAWVFFTRRQVKMRAAGCLVLTAALVMGIWALRNYRIYQVPIFGAANSGYNLLVGNSENTTPNGGPSTDISRYSGVSNDIERDAYYRRKAVEFIIEHKARSAGLYALKVLNYFNYRNDLVTRSEMSSLKDMVMLLTYGPLLLLFFVGIAIRRVALSPLERFIAILYISNAFFAAIFFTRIRFRIPFDFLLVLVDAAFIASWVQRRFTEIPLDARPNLGS